MLVERMQQRKKQMVENGGTYINVKIILALLNTERNKSKKKMTWKIRFP